MAPRSRVPIIRDKIFFAGTRTRSNTDPRPLSVRCGTSQVPNLTDATRRQHPGRSLRASTATTTGGILPINRITSTKSLSIKLDANLSERQKLSFSVH